MEVQKRASVNASEITVHPGTIEGVVFVGGRPQVEPSDMPLSLSFDSIEELERFCNIAKVKREHDFKVQ